VIGNDDAIEIISVKNRKHPLYVDVAIIGTLFTVPIAV